MSYWVIKFRKTGLYYDITSAKQHRTDIIDRYDSVEDAREEIRKILTFDSSIDVKLVAENGKPYIVKVHSSKTAHSDESDDCDPVPDGLEFLIVWKGKKGELHSQSWFSEDIVEVGPEWKPTHTDVNWTDIISITRVFKERLG